MRYDRPLRDSARRNKKKERKRKHLPTRNLRGVIAEIKPRVLGGPNIDFLEQYGLEESSHPMDWFTAFMPLTPNANKEDPAIANVKGDCKTKFVVSNWTANSNTKAMMLGLLLPQQARQPRVTLHGHVSDVLPSPHHVLQFD
jgi:hypothetical protein